MEDGRRHAPATLRNREPILASLRAHLPSEGLILEIASGSGEHCAYFAGALPQYSFQPSDRDRGAQISINAWIKAMAVPNVLPAIEIDASADLWCIEKAQAIICSNMIHISPWAAAIGLFRGAARTLPTDAPLFIYGPYRRNGGHISDGNAKFDADLRAENPEWGVRDLEDMIALATDHGFSPPLVEPMPANNLMLVLRKPATSPA
jgi:hypothetical protein